MSTNADQLPEPFTPKTPEFVRIRGFADYYGESNFLFLLAGEPGQEGFTATAVSQAAFVTTVGEQPVYFADMLVPFSTELKDALVARRNLFIEGPKSAPKLFMLTSLEDDGVPGQQPPKGPPYHQNVTIEYV